ncbi:MFS transporter [Streptomyces prunicolor]|uniref:MFS transporter n=1 Tax=Streptomyces prunicolor TaxID=67348 RepID=A0ABU4FDT4_9ACTN|nr:MFS transporter [Streptomyces prunicolor]MDV7218763.1 MFS transporter [Streptomyces prunicolor]
MSGTGTSSSSRRLTLSAMIFAVAMTFIDQTIVSIAAPNIQAELGLSNTGVQWAINSYLLAMAALFAFGGRLADTVGHRRMVVLGVVVFAVASALCGLTPKGAAAEGWLIAFRALQGAGGALMYPAALAIVVNSYALQERGKALALFFGIAGGLTAVGPILGGWLTQWTWRAIFWVNIPVAVVALVLIAMARPHSPHRPAPMDYRGLALIVAGVGLSIFGFQQSYLWGWHSVATWLCIVVGLLLLVVFVLVERRTAHPLLDVELFRDRAFSVQNVVLGVAMAAFVPVFFFTSVYAEVALGKKPSEASLDLLYFFLGFVVAAQVGGRMLDRIGAKRPVVLGCALSCVGYFLWAGRVTGLSESRIVWCIVLAGAGMGLMLGQANTDAVNRVPQLSYGEATGVTQTVRNYGSSLGLAVLGTIFASVLQSRITQSLTAQGMGHDAASREAKSISQLSSGQGSGGTASLPHFVRLGVAEATRSVLLGMSVIMAVAFVVALFGLRRGVQQELPADKRESRPAPAPETGD